jgi:hypothetical protein
LASPALARRTASAATDTKSSGEQALWIARKYSPPCSAGGVPGRRNCLARTGPSHPDPFHAAFPFSP